MCVCSLFGRNIRILCLTFHGVCKCRCVAELRSQDSFTVPEDASRDLKFTSLPLERVLAHPFYSPDLASPPDVHLSGPLEGRRFADEGELKHGVSEGIRRFSQELYTGGIQRLKDRWKNSVNSEGMITWM